MLNSEEQNELRHLAWNYHESTLSPAEAARLEELVLREPQACALFVRWSTMVNDLEWQCASLRPEEISVPEESVSTIGNAPIDQTSGDFLSTLSAAAENANTPVFSPAGRATTMGGPGISISMFLSLLVTAVALTAAMTAWLIFGLGVRSVAQPALAQQNSEVMTPVAFLTSANGCAWGGDSLKTWTVGHSVQPGSEISLNEGIAEFRLANGVALSIEGPASFVLASPSTLALQYGKLTAHVQWGAPDFRVIAGACRFTACDSEFGLQQDGNKVEVHVFTGAVRAESSLVADETDVNFVEGGALVIDDAGAFTKGTITAGNALSLISEGESLSVAGVVGQKAKPENFATKLSMAGTLPITKAYVDAVLASKPIGYWRFESISDRLVANEISGGKPLKVVGNVRLTGTTVNSAVEFRPKMNTHFVSDPFNDLTNSDYSLEVWVKPSHVHKGNVMSLMWSVGDRNGSTSLELQGTQRSKATKNPPGAVRFVHHAPARAGTSGISAFSKKRYDVRRWQHIVAVKEGSRMRLYVDGKLRGSARDNTSFSSELRLFLGWVPFNPELGFVGQMDEVALYDRALSEKEVVGHYEALEDEVNRPSSNMHEGQQASSTLLHYHHIPSEALAISRRVVDLSGFSFDRSVQ